MSKQEFFSAIKLLTATSFLTFALSAHAANVGFNKSIDVGSSATIEISTNAGNVDVQGADTDKVEIRAIVEVDKRLKRRDPTQADSLLRAVVANPPIEVEGDKIVIGPLKTHKQKRYVTISYEIVVPNPSDVTARSESGDIRVSGVQGRVDASSEKGEVS